MPSYLQMSKQQQVVALLALDWSYRRIDAETSVRRETVSRYDRTRRANAAKVFPGSAPAAPDASEADGPPDDPNAANVFAGSPPNAAKLFPGSPPRSRGVAGAYRTAITEPSEMIPILFTAIDAEEWERVGACFHPSAVYERPGYEPYVGRDAVLQFYRRVHIAGNEITGETAHPSAHGVTP